MAASRVNSFVQFITLLIVFVIVLFLTYYTTKFIGNYQRVSNRYTNFEVVETYRISNNKYIQIIKVSGKYILISVTKDNVTMLTELDKKNVVKPEYTTGQQSFSEILDKFKNLKKHTVNSADENEEQGNEEDKQTK
ncbi:MAG: flagellar biosynthetic protein FliO [Lachnospiraceae bacterium]|jgi:flagellar protein FliO/FliZ|nr:flagellar biosynthetic protein FliO [Lachnospiraceae bacterium]MDY6328191.1 flagellar biosynthetic protein FliO [Lachnospiraceae bacterium]